MSYDSDASANVSIPLTGSKHSSRFCETFMLEPCFTGYSLTISALFQVFFREGIRRDVPT